MKWTVAAMLALVVSFPAHARPSVEQVRRECSKIAPRAMARKYPQMAPSERETLATAFCSCLVGGALRGEDEDATAAVCGALAEKSARPLGGQTWDVRSVQIGRVTDGKFVVAEDSTFYGLERVYLYVWAKGPHGDVGLTWKWSCNGSFAGEVDLHKEFAGEGWIAGWHSRDTNQDPSGDCRVDLYANGRALASKNFRIVATPAPSTTSSTTSPASKSDSTPIFVILGVLMVVGILAAAFNEWGPNDPPITSAPPGFKIPIGSDEPAPRPSPASAPAMPSESGEKDERLLGANSEKAWEIQERARIEREVADRKRQEAIQADAAKQQEERVELSKKLDEAIVANDTVQEIELRLQIARLDRDRPPESVIPEPVHHGLGYSGGGAVPVQAQGLSAHEAVFGTPKANTQPSPAGHGRLAFFGYNLLITIPVVLLMQVHPLFLLSGFPFHYLNVRGRLQNIGWKSEGGTVLLWTLGMCVPILGLVLGLTLLFTPGRPGERS